MHCLVGQPVEQGILLYFPCILVELVEPAACTYPEDTVLSGFIYAIDYFVIEGRRGGQCGARRQFSVFLGINGQSFLARQPEAALAVAQDVCGLYLWERSSVCQRSDSGEGFVFGVEAQKLADSAYPEFTVFRRFKGIDIVGSVIADCFDASRPPVQNTEASVRGEKRCVSKFGWSENI